MKRFKNFFFRLSLLLILGLAWAYCCHAQRDTLSVFFPFNESTLSESEGFRIDSAVYRGFLAPGFALRIIGYADAVGTDPYNVTLSRRRALEVKAYLLRSGFHEKDIQLILARGESLAAEPARPGGNLRDRRVDIVPEPIRRRPIKDSVIIMADMIPTAPTAPAPVPAAMDLSKVVPGQTLVLQNIYFYPGRHIVRKESDSSLQALLQALQAYPTIKIRIEGHVCCIPLNLRDALDNDTGTEELSLNRAAAIRAYLIRHGIAPERLSIAGFGHRYPVVSPERSEADANQNRRVEIRVLK